MGVFFSFCCRLLLDWKHLRKVQCSSLLDLPFRSCEIGGILFFMIPIYQSMLLLKCLSLHALGSSGFQEIIELVDHSKESREATEQRKVQSIRKHYYSMRKRSRCEIFKPTDLGFLDEPNLHKSSGHVADFHGFGREPQDRNCMLGSSNSKTC